MVNIALGASRATLAAYWTGSPWLVLCGILGMLLSCLHAWASLRHRVDQIVSGLACNFLSGSRASC